MKDNYNEIILNGLRLTNGININNIKAFKNLYDKSKIDKIIDKWDCLSIKNNKIRLTNNGFLFVDEITEELFV